MLFWRMLLRMQPHPSSAHILQKVQKCTQSIKVSRETASTCTHVHTHREWLACSTMSMPSLSRVEHRIPVVGLFWKKSKKFYRKIHWVTIETFLSLLLIDTTVSWKKKLHLKETVPSCFWPARKPSVTSYSHITFSLSELRVSFYHLKTWQCVDTRRDRLCRRNRLAAVFKPCFKKPWNPLECRQGFFSGRINNGETDGQSILTFHYDVQGCSRCVLGYMLVSPRNRDPRDWLASPS